MNKELAVAGTMLAGIALDTVFVVGCMMFAANEIATEDPNLEMVFAISVGCFLGFFFILSVLFEIIEYIEDS